MASEFKLPELGENVDSGTITKIVVSEGDEVQEEQTVIELETDKAVFEVPADVSGIVKEILVNEGDEVKVGQKILVLQDGEGKPKEKAPQRSEETEKESGATETATETVEEKPKEEEPAKQKAKETTEKKKTKKTKAGEIKEFKLPELGEGVESGTVTKVLVSSGETIEREQNVLELETDKAVFELPSDVSGTIKAVLIKEGEEVKLGQPLLKIQTAAEETEIEEAPAEKPEVEEGKAVEEKAEEKPLEPKEEKVAEKPTEVSTTPAAAKKMEKPRKVAPAAPSVRRFARELGIDINDVAGTGPGGRISIEDVKNYSKMLHQQRTASESLLTGVRPEPLPDFSKWGNIERETMSNVRKTTARHLSYAWTTIPHVTQFDKADITQLEELRKQYGKKVEAAGGKLTVTAILLKIVSAALKVFPKFNASIDIEKQEIIYKHYYNIGVAVDTDRGLLVPVIQNVDQKSITELAIELTDKAQKARDRKLTLEDMQGGNFSISNLGGLGGTGFAPVVNSPDVAILGVSRTQVEAVYVDGKFEPRKTLPLSVSYDHRLIDGADAARFLRWIAEAIEQPFLIVLES